MTYNGSHVKIEGPGCLVLFILLVACACVLTVAFTVKTLQAWF